MFSLQKVLKVTSLLSPAKLTPVPGMSGHAPCFLRVKVESKVIHNIFEVIQCGRLAPDHMGHGPGPEAEVQGIEVR